MLETIVIVLILLWLLGMIAVPIAGGLIHTLLILAVAVILIRAIQGRPAL